MQTLPQSALPLSALREDFLCIEQLSKVYPTAKGPLTVVENINLTVKEGEFVCLIGHSGCGKTTLLNMVAGFSQPTVGTIRLDDEWVVRPGLDRMMVFQNYSLLPWLTVAGNIELAVKQVFQEKSKAEVRQHVDHRRRGWLVWQRLRSGQGRLRCRFSRGLRFDGWSGFRLRDRS
ncbi:MAG: ATP-binding cassette domain-containing protein [Leptolyngbyaceae cyanobacterium RM2_2_21]|nr:ATP-binding cassette domain-containing protein [Leptolyngbyaceae cyanobacterium RM2_2_21]